MRLELGVLADKVRRGVISPGEVADALDRAGLRASEVAQRLRFAIAAQRGGASAYVVHVTRCDLGAIVNDVLKQLEPTQRDRVVVSGPLCQIEGYWDGDRITQMLRELLENALKYSPVDRPVRLGIAANGEVELTVRDEGIGIAASELPRLFDPSFRSSRVASVPGTGLGLYATKVVVEAHGGRIWAESAGVGRGSSLHVVLPR